MKNKKGVPSPTDASFPDGLEQLKNALESGAYKETLVTPPVIQAEDAYLPLNHLFNAASKKAFKKEVKTLISKRHSPIMPVEATDRVAFFGCVAVGERNIFDAAKCVAYTVNGYASQGLVTGVLLKLSIIKLWSEEWELDKYVVVSYPCMTSEGYDLAKADGVRDANSCWCEEGGISKAIVK